MDSTTERNEDTKWSDESRINLKVKTCADSKEDFLAICCQNYYTESFVLDVILIWYYSLWWY